MRVRWANLCDYARGRLKLSALARSTAYLRRPRRLRITPREVTVSLVKLHLFFQSAGVPAHYPNKPLAPRNQRALGKQAPGLPAWPLRALGRLGIVALARRCALRRLAARLTCYSLFTGQLF